VAAGQANRALATVQVRVSVGRGSPGQVTLDVRGVPAGVGVSFEPQRATPPFESVLTLWTDWPDLARAGSYAVTIVGAAGGLSREAALRLDVTRTLTGDLSVLYMEAVQVVDAAGYNAPLIKNKATVFKLNVESTFTRPVTATLRLLLSSDQWTALRLIRPPDYGLSASAIQPSLPYPEIWGPVRINPGNNLVLLPNIPPGHEGAVLNPPGDPAGIITARCWGIGYAACTIDTRYVPRPIASSVSADVQLDPGNRIAETNETNNAFRSSPQPVVNTRPWKFLIMPHDEVYENAYLAAPSGAEAFAAARDQLEYLLGTFPIADNKISFSVGLETHWENRRGHAGYEADWEFFNRIQAIAQRAGFDFAVAMTRECLGGWTMGGIGMVIGACGGEGSVVMGHEFNHATTGMGDDYALDVAAEWDESYCQLPDGTRRYCIFTNSPSPAGTRKLFCIQPDRWTEATCPETRAKTQLVSCGYSGWWAYPEHQILSNKWTCLASCTTACNALGGTPYSSPDGRIAHPADDGFWVNKWAFADRSLNYMMDTPATTRLPKVWQRIGNIRQHNTGTVFRDGWLNLTRSAVFLSDSDPAGLAVSGVITRTGTTFFNPFVRLPETRLDLEPGAPGEYRFRLLDAAGTVLNETGFDASFYKSDPNGGPVDHAPFAYRIAWAEGTRRIELVRGEQVLASRDVSPSAPEVTLVSPNGGQVYRAGQGPIPVRWAATDPDGNPLAYSVLISPDDGETWLPVAIDLPDQAFTVSESRESPAGSLSYDVPTDRLAAGKTYRVKVIATDGVNSAEAVSHGIFAVEGTLYLPLVIR
jgi:hypothetical protein